MRVACPRDGATRADLRDRHPRRDQTLDLQYCSWHPDVTGILMLDEACAAAGRAVRVRMLRDGNGIGGLDSSLAVLDAHPLMEARLFNPFRQRWFKPLGPVADFRRLNRRMRDKSLTADTWATIERGRHVGDVHMGADADVVFSGLGMQAMGPAAAEVILAFAGYWDSAMACAARAVIGTPPRPRPSSRTSTRARSA